MAHLSNTSHKPLRHETARALDEFKYEVAREIKLRIPGDRYWGNIPSAQCGAVGGQMVRKMIEMAEQNLVQGRASRGRR